MKRKECKKCLCEEFKINIINDCSKCSENGAYDETTDSYIYCENTIDADMMGRDEAFCTDQCRLGDNHNNGCHQYICTECGHIDHLPLADN